jgi:2-keto-4-pentenoate hydratase
MHALARYGWISVMVLFPVLAHAACPDEAAVAAYLADFKAARVSKGFGSDLTLADAECARAKLVKELPQVLGRVVGYKAAFTNPAVQERVGVKSPAWG